MAINTSSGYIGLGSRLFLNKETDWGTRPGSVDNRGFEQYNIYNQEGSRPQKVTTPIEVSQLYPSMLRRKPIKNSVSVEGSYTFSLPTTNAKPFMQLITGDEGGDPVLNEDIITVLANNGSALTLTTTTSVANTQLLKAITIAGVTTDAPEEDEYELSLINTTHQITVHDAGSAIFVLDTLIDIVDPNSILSGAISLTNAKATIGGHTYDLQQEVNTSYEFVQSISTKQLALYTGMMAQSTTINISPDDVANIEMTFLGQDEILYPAKNSSVTTIFGVNQGGYMSCNDATEEITSVNASYFDNCTEFYPSWSAKLLVMRKNGVQFQPLVTVVGDTEGEVGWGDAVANFNASGDALPFSDLSITINNNLEFPAYLNGTKTRNQPVQTTYKEVTGSITLPYNEFTRQFVKAMFDQDSFEFRVVLTLAVDDLGAGSSATDITIKLPEVCIIGDSLADIPAGEMTLPINFGAYASKTASTYDNPISTPPLVIEFGNLQT